MISKGKKRWNKGAGGGNETATGAGEEKAEKKKCEYCGRAYLDKVPEELCYKPDVNASDIPGWYKHAKAKRALKAASKT